MKNSLIDDRYNLLDKLNIKNYFMQCLQQGLDKVYAKDYLDVIIIKKVQGVRAFARRRTIVMDPYTRSFQPDYKGYMYKTFGGLKDLTPGGVFLHEFGHVITTQALLSEFSRIRRTNKKSVTSYGSGHVGEDIAETFRVFASNPMLLKNYDIARYEVMLRYTNGIMRK